MYKHDNDRGRMTVMIDNNVYNKDLRYSILLLVNRTLVYVIFVIFSASVTFFFHEHSKVYGPERMQQL